MPRNRHFLFAIITSVKIYIARHAETNYNLLNLCNDSPLVDVYLTPNGIKQGKILAESLKDVAFDLIITSEFPRTKETARLINTYHHAPVMQDKRINDVVTGFEGQPVSEFRDFRKNSSNPWTAKFKSGESFEDEKARVGLFLDNLKTMDANVVLVVTHQAIARLIYANINKLPNERVRDLEVSNTHCFDFEL